MPRISQDSIRRVREANDIVEVIGAYVSLHRAGSGYKALCPFHKENSASFTVSHQRQTFKCFGCGVGGSVVDFIMQFEKLEFIEAIERLAERASVEIEYEGGRGQSAAQTATKSRKAMLYEAMEWARKSFRAALTSLPEAEIARGYLKKRGYTPDIWADWGFGYARDAYDALLKAAREKGHEPALLDEAGLTRVSDGGSRYDFFRGRLLFPINDVTGRVVAFGARKLKEDDPGGKYINSPTTPIYDKSRVLYGIDRLAASQYNRGRAKGGKLVIVVEGYFDVIALHRAGIDCAVAPCGTSITPDQIRTLRRFGDRIVLVMDGDAAGQASMERIAGEVIAQGADVTAVTLTGGKDPDEFLLTHTAQDFIDLVEKGQDIFTFKLKALGARYDLSRPASRVEAAEEALAIAAMSENELLRNEIIRRTGEFFDIGEAALRSRLKALARSRPAGGAGPATPAKPARAAIGSEGRLLLRLLTHPELVRPVSEFMEPGDFASADAAEVYRAILNCHDELGEARAPGIFDYVAPEKADARSLLTELVDGPVSLARYDGSKTAALTAAEVVEAAGSIRRWLDKRRRAANPRAGMVANGANDGAARAGLDEMRRLKTKG